MAYVTYEFYINEYLKGRTPLIDESSFGYYAQQAKYLIDEITLDKAKKSEYTSELAMCVCALCEANYKYEQSATNKGISSERVGEYSVSYANTKTDYSVDVMGIVRRYLGSTGLLFRGVSYVHK